MHSASIDLDIPYQTPPESLSDVMTLGSWERARAHQLHAHAHMRVHALCLCHVVRRIIVCMYANFHCYHATLAVSAIPQSIGHLLHCVQLFI